MKCNDYPYKRPNMEEVTAAFNQSLEQFEQAESVEIQEQAMGRINALRLDFETMMTLSSIRHSVNTKDPFYEGEEEFFNENRPLFEQLTNRFYKALAGTRFIDQLKERQGSLLFDMAIQSLKTFDDSIVEDLQQENKLTHEYQKLTASAEIDFEGEIRNLSQMTPFTQSTDRDMRKRASKAVSHFFEANEARFDDLYDQLVKVRTVIAQKLGYKNFVELAYDRLGRLDYGASEVASYRKQVKEELVPLVRKLVERQAKRLGIDTLTHYDLPLSFLSGNPTPKGDKDWMVQRASRMYREMSKETDEFFTFMMDRELLDLEAKKGKAGGGYCTYIPNHSAPFIFANFNGTSHDVDVLTHEAGHAFQVYSSRHHKVPEYLWPTTEACEIHSMSMEFFAWPWIHEFFLEDTEKYKFSHLEGTLKFIPYGVLVDAFQHEVYEKPEMTPAQRKAVWRKLEQEFMPYKQYEDDSFLDRGGFWFRQLHIFMIPFYYIDYTLAQVCAFQYWIKSREDLDSAWKSYVHLCKLGGSKTFLALLKEAGLDNPFSQGTIGKSVVKLEAYLNGVDDSAF